MMTKRYKASKECFLRRRAFVITMKGKYKEKEGLPYNVSITI